MTHRIALVTPWYGNRNGGAEVFCAGLARSLATAGIEVEVLTTCCKDPFHDWSTDYHPSGESTLDGIPVRRFGVNPRDAGLYVKLFTRIEQGERLTQDEEILFLRNSINSSLLERHIASRRNDALFFFLPYLYGTTVHGAAAAGDRGYLIPCLHDESCARLEMIGEMFRNAGASLYLSDPEQALAEKLYGLKHEMGFFLGGGVSDAATSGDAEAFRQRSAIAGPFLLFVGRKVPGKGADMLVRYFAEYLDYFPEDDLNLVMIGTGDVDIPSVARRRVFSLMAETAQEVFDAMAACEILIQPSFYESFSLVMMEAWLNSKPIVVNGECEVTRHHVLTGNAGLWFRSFPEFAECIRLLRSRPATATRLGACGKRYVLENFTWPKVAERFRKFLSTVD